MDTRNGHIFTAEAADALRKARDDDGSVIPMEREPTAKQLSRKPPKVGRNEPCPCGSGKKFKKCHLTVTGSRPGEFDQRLYDLAIERGWATPVDGRFHPDVWNRYWAAMKEYENNPDRGRPVRPHISGGASKL